MSNSGHVEENSALVRVEPASSKDVLRLLE
jgi:hypothetical protein